MYGHNLFDGNNADSTNQMLVSLSLGLSFAVLSGILRSYIQSEFSQRNLGAYCYVVLMPKLSLGPTPISLDNNNIDKIHGGPEPPGCPV